MYPSEEAAEAVVVAVAGTVAAEESVTSGS